MAANAPYTYYKAVDISSADHTPTHPFRALHVGVAGNVVLKGMDGENVIFKLAVGTHQITGKAVIRTSTTATDMVMLF